MALTQIILMFALICGAAIQIFLIKQECKIFAEVRQQIRELPPEVRRQNTRNLIRSALGMLVALGLIFGTYEWGAHAWTTRTGAALAILVFVIVVGAGLIALVVQAHRASQCELRMDKSDHTSQ